LRGLPAVNKEGRNGEHRNGHAKQRVVEDFQPALGAARRNPARIASYTPRTAVTPGIFSFR
jgi:hypothetical protein